ncbi:phytoene desaturase family protein [Microbacterium resistens]|uniref:phytoene desaturase family protein n=1 Tax=Microbacterium resistens TaxID=156977 RepID=UPI000831E42A|nr:NAD(P)/FAD-dependent oxidoreductase [Microbacterium resistens]MBW1640435.1 NAD(P)/FAD-dependent oxidoreductase [Microbacterium resistens]MDA4893671.1 NAD(P)/FAD-dependent oxidoreductase [Streptomyces sp. MS2A]
MTDGFDAIVVGGGHSGLVGAFYLARAGWKVLVLEARSVVGGCCVTEEVVPGYRCSAVSNSSHSLDPRIIADMELTSFGLRYTSPPLGSLTLFEDGQAFVPWPDRAQRRAQVERFAHGPSDVEGFFGVLERIRRVAQRMRVSFHEAPPTLAEVAARFTTAEETEDFNALMFGSVGDLLDQHLRSPHLKAFFAATAVATNLVGPYTPGSAYLLLQRPLYEESMAAFGVDDRNDLMMKNAAPLGGIGSVTQAMARSAEARGARIEVDAPVERILTDGGRVVGVRLVDGREFFAPRVLSNADPKRTLTELVRPEDLPDEFVARARRLKMDGTSAKVHIAMTGAPRFAAAEDEAQNELFLPTNFRVASSMEVLQEAYNEAIMGRWSRRVTVTGLMDSAIDPEVVDTPGHHIMSLSVRGVPYHLAEGTWDDQRDELGEAVLATVATHMPNVPDILDAVHVYTPLDLEREFGLVEGSGSHGDIVPGRILDARPLAGAADYTTPLKGLYLCGVGTWPGNFMSGVTGHNASNRMIADRENGTTAYDEMEPQVG